MPPRPSDPDWHERSSCGPLGYYIGRGDDGEPVNDVWFPDGEGAAEQRAIARRICHHCPVAVDCLRDALREEWGATSGSKRQGIRAGTSGPQRARMEMKMRRAKAEPKEDPPCEIAS